MNQPDLPNECPARRPTLRGRHFHNGKKQDDWQLWAHARAYFKWLPCQPRSSRWLHVTPQALRTAGWIIQAFQGDGESVRARFLTTSTFNWKVIEIQRPWEAVCSHFEDNKWPRWACFNQHMERKKNKKKKPGQTTHNPLCCILASFAIPIDSRWWRRR